MDSGPTDPVRSHLDGVNLSQIDTIPASAPFRDVVQCTLEHEKNGTPLVITGVHFDQHWHSQPPMPFLMVNSPADHETVDGITERDGSPTLPWLESLSLIPEYLLSRGTDNAFPQALRDLKQQRGENGQTFQQNHCGSVLQHLTSGLPDGSSDVWFVGTASEQIASYLRATISHSSAFLTASELSSCPFPIYTHRQSVGDLLILPPSCYGQNFREGQVYSISWSRITMRSLELSIYRELPMYKRLCRPERYEIRRVIHGALLSHTSKLNELATCEAGTTSEQASQLPCVVQELSTLVRLFDEVLLEEYCKDHHLLDTPDVQQGRLACSFCGSCLFLSSFFCNGCSEETSMPVLICAGCYVEGRTCHCDAMNALRLGDFQCALRDRNNAVSSLLKSPRLHPMSTEGLVEVSESFFAWPRVAVFEAARELWKSKNAPDVGKRGKTCTLRGREHTSHPSPPISLVNCKKCHAAKCFSHILEGLVHASEAILANSVESGSTVWHKRHQEARERKVNPSTNLSSVCEFGVLERRVFFARHFPSASPLRPGMRLGFYDIPFPSTESSSNHQTMATTDVLSAPPLSAGTPLSRTSSWSTVTLETDAEVPGVVNQQSLWTRNQSMPVGDSDPGPSTRKRRRARSPDSEGDDDEYLPAKRVRVGLSSTRPIRTTQSTSSIAAPTSEQSQPVRKSPIGLTPGRSSGPDTIPSSSQPTDDQEQTQSSVGQATPRRRPTRTASVASTLSRAPSTIICPPAAEPLVFKFFNPSVDMGVTAQPVDPTAAPSTLTGASLDDHSETGRPQGSTFVSLLQGQLPESPLIGLRSFEAGHSSSSSGLFGAGGLNSSRNTSPATENALGPATAGRTPPCRTPFRVDPPRQGSLLRPHTNPANSQASGLSTTSRAIIHRRRSSREEIEAQRVLETIEGDSLSRENIGAYIDILRSCGGLEE